MHDSARVVESPVPRRPRVWNDVFQSKSGRMMEPVRMTRPKRSERSACNAWANNQVPKLWAITSVGAPYLPAATARSWSAFVSQYAAVAEASCRKYK
jgi:hypothetical protein